MKRMKMSGIPTVLVNTDASGTDDESTPPGTITIIKFWTSNFCHIKKITLNHALLKLSHER
jgi:hypothetical protein